MKTYKLFKTDLVISTGYGRRCIYYAPDLDLCFVHYTPKKSNHTYAVGGWTQVDCGDHNWTKLKETVHAVEWDGPEMTRLEKAKAHYENKVECATPSVETPLFEIKRELLSECLDEFFDGKPTTEEQKWIDAELEEIDPFIATEYF